MPSTDPSQPRPPTTKRLTRPTKTRSISVRPSRLVSALIDAEVEARNLPSVTSFIELATILCAHSPKSRELLKNEIENNPSLIAMFAAYTPVPPPRASVKKLVAQQLKEAALCQDSSQI